MIVINSEAMKPGEEFHHSENAVETTDCANLHVASELLICFMQRAQPGAPRRGATPEPRVIVDHIRTRSKRRQADSVT